MTTQQIHKKKRMTLANDDYTITKEMVETNEFNEIYTPKKVIGLLLRYFLFEENLTLEDTIKKIEKFFDDNEKYYKDGYIGELCEEFSRSKGFKPLKRLETIKLYESDIKVINSLPNQDVKRTYLTMMIENKINRQLRTKEENMNTMFYEFYQYTNYCTGKSGITRPKSNEILKYLQQNGLIDVPLFELDRMYYTAPQESGKVLYELDPTKLDKKNLLQQFYIIFGKGTSKKIDTDCYMIIDLTKPFGNVVVRGIEEVKKHLISQGVKKSLVSDIRIEKVLQRKQYLLDKNFDFTIVRVEDNDDKKYLLSVECMQRDIVECSRKLYQTVPIMILEIFFSYVFTSHVRTSDIDWQQVIKFSQKKYKVMKQAEKETEKILKELREQK